MRIALRDLKLLKNSSKMPIREAKMVIERQVCGQGKWVFEEGRHPLQVKVVTAGEMNPQEHLHQRMYEYFYIITGKVKMAVAGRIIELVADDMLLVEPGEKHIIYQTSADLKMLLIMPPPIKNDKIIFSDKND